MLVYSVLILLLAALIVCADKMYDEKYSQPMSEKDMVLGKKFILEIFPLFLISFPLFTSFSDFLP
jgi:hypothetical protein